MKIEQKITSTFLGAFLAIFILVAFSVATITFFVMLGQAQLLVHTASLTKTEYLRSYLESQKELGNVLAGASIFRDLLSESSGSATYAMIKKQVDERLARTIALDANINELFIIDKGAKVIASSNPRRLNENVAADPFYTEGKKGVFLRSIYHSSITKNLAWGIAVPLFNDITKEVAGVIVIRLQTNPLFDLVRSQSNLGNTAEAIMIDSSHTLISPSQYLAQSDVLRKKIETQNVRECFDPREVEAAKKRAPLNSLETQVKTYTDYRNVFVLGTHSYIPEMNWCLVTKIDASEVFLPVVWIIFLIFCITFCGSLVFFFISSSLSKKITQPIEELYRGVQKIQGGDITLRVGTTSQDEIGILSRQFDSLIASVREAQTAVDQKVKDQTKEIARQTKHLQDQKMAILNILEDVRLQKDTSERLASDLKKFELAVENTNDQIVITDPDGIILFANKSAERTTGFPIQEIVGKKAGVKELWGGLMPKSFYDELWKTIKIEKKTFSGEVSNKRKNGEIYYAKVSISPILDNEGHVDYFVGVERDITKEYEVDKMKTEFISLASHQLRTPLSATRWFAEMLLDGDMGELSQSQKDAIASIYSSNKRMIDLVNSLLNISRIESGRMIIDPKPTHINKLVKDVIKGLEKKTTDKKQRIVLRTPADIPLIPLDEKLIHEVYTNLLTNAIKYSPENTEISVTLSLKDGNLISQIADSGYGIPLAQQRMIFQKFFRANNVVKRETDGTGLGLYLVKSIIESSGGKIWFESKEDKGTTFWFTLPTSGMKAHVGEVEISLSETKAEI